MSSARIKQFLNRCMTIRPLLYFLIFWLATLVFLGLFSHLVKNQLQKQERLDIRSQVSLYFSETFPSGPTFSAFKRGGGAIALHGLSFVRMVSGREQVFFLRQ